MATKKTASKPAAKAAKKVEPAKAKAPVKAKPVKEQVSPEGTSEIYQPQFIGDSFRRRAQQAAL